MKTDTKIVLCLSGFAAAALGSSLFAPELVRVVLCFMATAVVIMAVTAYFKVYEK